MFESCRLSQYFELDKCSQTNWNSLLQTQYGTRTGYLGTCLKAAAKQPWVRKNGRRSLSLSPKHIRARRAHTHTHTHTGTHARTHARTHTYVCSRTCYDTSLVSHSLSLKVMFTTKITKNGLCLQLVWKN